jgi:probable F420-dependent oxidoreductase
LRSNISETGQVMQIGAAMFFTDYSISAAELARALEERGFESVWAPEHSHIPLARKSAFPGGGDLPKQYYDVMDPFVSLSSAAAVTNTLKLGTGVCLVIQRDTIQTAKLVTSLDQVSRGRFLFGVGGGWNRDEMEDHGTVFATRFKKMREQIEAMRVIWTDSKPEYHGEIVDFPAMMTRPKPVQKPYPPVIVGGMFPHAAGRDPLRQWLDPAFAPSAIRGRDRLPAAIPGDDQGSRPRLRRGAGHGLGGAARSRPAQALSRAGGQPRRRAAGAGAGRQDIADPRSLGGTDPETRRRSLTRPLAAGERRTGYRGATTCLRGP